MGEDGLNGEDGANGLNGVPGIPGASGNKVSNNILLIDKCD